MNDVDIELLRSYAEGANDGVEMMRLYSETLARVDSLETLAERLETENERLREALKWSLKNGVVYHRTYDTDEVFFSDAGCGCCSSLTEPPPHLQEMILKIARQEKT